MELQHYCRGSKSRPFHLPLGRVVATGGAIAALFASGDMPGRFLDRHASGDWGDVPEADRRLNDTGAMSGVQVLSSYETSAGDRLWIITEADRSVTTLLLPEEY